MLKPYTLASRTSHRSNQNLPKSMSLTTLKEMLTKLKETEGMKPALGTTLYISNGGQCAINKVNKYNLAMVQLWE